MPDEDLLSISTTAFLNAAKCAHLYEYAQVLQLRPKPREISTAIRRGIWTHSGRQAIAKGRDWRPQVRKLEEWAKHHQIPQEKIDSVSGEVAYILAGHERYWSTREDPYEHLYTEEKMTCRVGNTIMTATVDDVRRYTSGPHKGVWLWEYKTTGDIPPPEWRAVDPQTAMQYVCFLSEHPELRDELRGIGFDYMLTKAPAIPAVRKSDGLLEDRVKHTTTWAFEMAAQAARANWEKKFHGKGMGVLEEHLAIKAKEIIHDEDWYQQYFVTRPEEYILETMKDVAAVSRQIRRWKQDGYYPRSFSVFTCSSFCTFGPLCMAEYLSGHESILREERYEPDDGIREGTLDAAE